MPAKPKVVVTFAGIDVSKLAAMFEVYQNSRSGGLARDDLLRECKDAVGVLCTGREKMDSDFLDHAKNLMVISTFSVGMDHIDLPECKKRGVIVGNTPDVLTKAVAELGVSLVLIANRRLVSSARTLLDGTVKPWAPFYQCGNGLEGQTVGVFGLGRIGQDVARKLQPFDPKEVIYHNRSPRTDLPGYTYVSLDDLVSRSDTLIISAAADGVPAGFFNLEKFRKMKSSATIVNISRGKVINHDDLAAALRDGIIGAAGLDVTDPEPLPSSHLLLTLENCFVTPHIASATFDTRYTMIDLAVNNLYNGLQGGKVVGPS